jgi:hypothetical protein
MVNAICSPRAFDFGFISLRELRQFDFGQPEIKSVLHELGEAFTFSGLSQIATRVKFTTDLYIRFCVGRRQNDSGILRKVESALMRVKSSRPSIFGIVRSSISSAERSICRKYTMHAARIHGLGTAVVT